MTCLSSLPTGVLIPGCLALALLVAIVGRLGVRALVPVEERDQVPQIAAPLMPALGATFAIVPRSSARISDTMSCGLRPGSAVQRGNTLGTNRR